jgi:hypothetical protein
MRGDDLVNVFLSLREEHLDVLPFAPDGFVGPARRDAAGDAVDE